MKACDLGIDDRLGQQCSEEAIYTICVTNVNHDPKLIFPNPDGSTVIKVYDVRMISFLNKEIKLQRVVFARLRKLLRP